MEKSATRDVPVEAVKIYPYIYSHIQFRLPAADEEQQHGGFHTAQPYFSHSATTGCCTICCFEIFMELTDGNIHSENGRTSTDK